MWGSPYRLFQIQFQKYPKCGRTSPTKEITPHGRRSRERLTFNDLLAWLYI